MSIIRELYEDLSILNSIEKTAKKVNHQHLTKEQQDYLNNERARLKKKIRKHQSSAGDPLATPIKDGGKRYFTDHDGGVWAYWIEPDEFGITDQEIDEYVDDNYVRHAHYPGDRFTHAYWYHIGCGLLIVTYSYLDV